MYKVIADIEKGKNGSIHFREYSRNNFENEIDAWNYLEKFKNYMEEFYDMKGFVKCYVCKNEWLMETYGFEITYKDGLVFMLEKEA